MTSLQPVASGDQSSKSIALAVDLTIDELRKSLACRTDFESDQSERKELSLRPFRGKDWYLRGYEESGKFFLFRQELGYDSLGRDYLCSRACLQASRQGDETVLEVSYDVGPEGQAWLVGCLCLLSVVGLLLTFVLVKSGGLAALFSPPLIIFVLVSFVIYKSTKYFVRILTENDKETPRAVLALLAEINSADG